MTQIAGTTLGEPTAEMGSDDLNKVDWRGMALVIGAGGIGRAVQQSLKQHCPELNVLIGGRRGGVGIDLTIDLEDDQSLTALTESLRRLDQPLRLVFNCSGRLHGPDLRPEKRLQQVSRAQLQEQFAINAMGPILLAKAIEPVLLRDQPFHFASLSARVGSIADNRSGGWYGYRAAKAAQNQLLRCLSIEWRRRWPAATVTLFHPGTTDTALSRPFQAFVEPEKLFTPQRAAEQLVHLLLNQTPEGSGQFLAWDGQVIPW